MKIFKIKPPKKDFSGNIIRMIVLGREYHFKIVSPSYLMFAFRYFNYLKRIKNAGKKNKTRRLFMTSGNLSLINTLAIINQFNLNENAENSILVWSHVASSEFIELTKKISEFTEIKNYYSFCNTSLMDLFNCFLLSKSCVFDEVYYLNCRYMIEIAKILFPYSKYYVMEEGVCVQYKHKNIDYSNVEKFIFNKYLDKIDIGNATPSDLEKLNFIDKNEFLKIGQKIAELYPLDIELNKEDKNVILCAAIAGLGVLSFEEIVECQNKIANKLIEKGYTVIFKPHPRDTWQYEEREKFKILKTKVPLEVYDIEDKCLATVSIFSSTSCQLYHFHKIPGFCDSELDKNAPNFGLNIVAQYSPDIDILYSIDVKNKTFEQAREEILKKYQAAMDKVPVLSKNEYLQEVFDKLPVPCPSDKYVKMQTLLNMSDRFLSDKPKTIKSNKSNF